MSVVDEIYQEISKLKIDGVKARNIDKIRLAVRKADLPCRMLLPSTRGEVEYVGIGSLNSITWVIRDLCLWAPLSAGSGVEQFSEGMLEYMQLYVMALKELRNPTGQSVVTNYAFEMGPVPWADKDYWAVDVTLTVQETI